ncbi:MAG: beta strand repeat-containing protein [Janthinobacterium lividum]
MASRNLISGNAVNGINIGANTDNTVTIGNYIGTNFDGSAAIANGGSGIVVSGKDNAIGGASASSGNLISGNAQFGIGLVAADSTIIRNNFIGTNVLGTSAIANGNDGINADANSNNNNTIGGGTGAGNLVSGNGGGGIQLVFVSFNNSIYGNKIGVNAAGTSAIANQGSGVALHGADNHVGSAAAGFGNVISGNLNYGINDSVGSNNIIQGNLIGVGSDGVTAIGNGYSGIIFTFGGNGALIGGSGSGEGNVIANNGGPGIQLTNFAGGAYADTISGNVIYDNAYLGIDFNFDGVTANDNLDADTGVNALQNFPVLVSAAKDGNEIVIAGTLNSTANTSFRIEFFASVTRDASGYGQAERYLGFTVVTTDASGKASFNRRMLAGSAATDWISATATDPASRNTSEFSQAIQNNTVVAGNVPVVSASSGSIAYTELGPFIAVDAALLVSNPNAATLDSAVVSIIGNFRAGDLLQFTNDGSTMGNITHTYDPATGIMLLSSAGATATTAEWQAALRSVAYSSTSNNPGTNDRTIGFAVTDGSLQSAVASKVIAVTGIDEAPVVNTSTGTTAYAENGAPLAIDTGLTLADNDNPGLSLVTVSITGGVADGQDVLGFTNTGEAAMGKITASYNSASRILTLRSLYANATLAQWQNALRAVTYSNNSDNPDTSNRTISFIVNDGTLDSAPATKTLGVAAVNDAPVVVTSPGASSYTENGAAIRIDGAITVSDVDNATLVSAQISIDTNFTSGDLLSFVIDAATMGNIHQSFNYPNYVTLASDDGSATLAQWQAALRAVYFQSNSDNPGSNDRGILYTVNDGNGNSMAATKIVRVTAVDDAPVVTTSGSTTAYAENAGATVIDGALTLADVDNTILASATVSINGGVSDGQDLLRFANTGAAAMGNITASYDSSARVLTLGSAGSSATVAQWQAALRAVTYFNTSDNPDTSNRLISFTVNDGALDSAPATQTVSVTASNDAPLIGTSPGTTGYTENDGFIAVDGALVVSDPDNTTLASATVRISANFFSGEDLLAFANDGVSMGNVAAAYDSSSGIMTLTSSGASATLAQWQSALRSVTYGNSSDNPSTLARTISFVANDGSADSLASTRTVAVTAVNDAPVITVYGNESTYYENSAPLAIRPALVLSDVDNTTLASASFSLTTGYVAGQDILAFTNTGNAAMGNISASYDAATGVLSMVSAGRSATLAQWQTALRSVTYANNSDAPITGDRTTRLVVNDGTSDSSVIYGVQHVAAVNDAPIGTPNTVEAMTNVAYVFSAADFGFTDPVDGAANAFLSVILTTLPSAGELTFNGVAVQAGDVVLKADIDAGALRFTDSTGLHNAGAQNVSVTGMTFQVRDDGGTAYGGVDTDAVARAMTIDVAPLNQAPVGTAHTVTTLENSAYTFSAADFGFTDPGEQNANHFLQVMITTLPATGSLSYSGAAVTAGSFIDVAAINAGALVYTPAHNANGAALATFSFRVRDDGGTIGGALDTDTMARRMTIAVTPVNSAPSGADHTVTLKDNAVYVFAAADFGFTDSSDSPSNHFASVLITSLPSTGSLTSNGLAVRAGSIILVTDIEAAGLVYSPGPQAGARMLSGFGFQVRDDGGLLDGGMDTDATVRLMSLDVSTTVVASPVMNPDVGAPLVANPGVIQLPGATVSISADIGDDGRATSASATAAAAISAANASANGAAAASASTARNANASASAAATASAPASPATASQPARRGDVFAQVSSTALVLEQQGMVIQANSARYATVEANNSGTPALNGVVQTSASVAAVDTARTLKVTVVQAPVDRRGSLMPLQKIPAGDASVHFSPAAAAAASEEARKEYGALVSTAHRIETAVAVTTLGAVWVVARKAALVASLLSTVPAWMRLDPLPILSGDDVPDDDIDTEADKVPDETDSVEHLFSVEGKAADTGQNMTPG